MCNLKEPESEIFFPKKKNGKLEHNATTFEMLNQMDCSKQNKTKKKKNRWWWWWFSVVPLTTPAPIRED